MLNNEFETLPRILVTVTTVTILTTRKLILDDVYIESLA